MFSGRIVTLGSGAFGSIGPLLGPGLAPASHSLVRALGCVLEVGDVGLLGFCLGTCGFADLGAQGWGFCSPFSWLQRLLFPSTVLGGLWVVF